MELEVFFKSIVEQDNCPVVVCDTNFDIIYMNPAAREKYKKHGELVGKSIFDCHNEDSNAKIRDVVAWFYRSPQNNRVFTFHSDKDNKDVYMIALRDENAALVGFYEKHEYRTLDTSIPYAMS